ncbi:MAG: DUF192 domain-containing protein [Anaerolineae bacterium]|nr:DUF192 domain-containing protein [Anaerolineae bacterium]
MTKRRLIRKSKSKEIVLSRAKWCQSFWCHFRGLQFVRYLDDDEGLLFVTKSESIVNVTIHMFFMFMEIAVIWLDSSGKVVDKKLAKPWRPAYAPKEAAQYYIEAPVSLLERVEIGDILEFDEEID